MTTNAHVTIIKQMITKSCAISKAYHTCWYCDISYPKFSPHGQNQIVSCPGCLFPAFPNKNTIIPWLHIFGLTFKQQELDIHKQIKNNKKAT